MRSVFESVIYSLRDVVEFIREMGYTVKQARTSGGSALRPLWRQIHADVFDSQGITVSGSSEGGAYGTALEAGAGVASGKTRMASTAFLKYTPEIYSK